MTIRSLPIVALPLLVLAACNDEPGEISRDSEPFAAIGEETRISALGTEPFWGIEIEAASGGYSATFSSAEDIDGSAFPVDRFAGNNGLGFSGDLDGRALQLAITPGECSDGMSDRSYPYTATAALGDATLLGCAYTSDEPFSGGEAP